MVCPHTTISLCFTCKNRMVVVLSDNEMWFCKVAPRSIGWLPMQSVKKCTDYENKEDVEVGKV